TAILEAHLLRLADRCAGQLRERGLVARTVSVKVRRADFTTTTRSRTLAVPTDVGREIYLAARDLLAATDLSGQPVRLVGVRAEGLGGAAGRPLTLEEAADGGQLPVRRAEAAVD